MQFPKKTINDVPLENKTVLVRTGFDTPLKKDNNDDIVVDDDYRIVKGLPTIKYLLEQNCRIVLVSKLGRPDGVDKSLSLEPVAKHLAQLLDKDVQFCPEVIGPVARQAKKSLKNGEVLMLENLLFDPRERDNSLDFAEEVAELCDYFVQDGFSSSHRENALVSAVTQVLPSIGGLLLVEEYEKLISAVEEGERPRCAIVGGAKIKTKRDLLDELTKSFDLIVVGGAMANTFLVAQGHDVGASVHDKSEVEDAKEIIAKVNSTEGLQLFIPSSGFATAKTVKGNPDREEKRLDSIAEDDLILDLGKPAIIDMLDFIRPAKTIIWNGPIGMTELDGFRLGSAAVLDYMVNNPGVDSIVGGGDTANFVQDMGQIDNLTHVSTGGGASLQLISGKKLPGVEALLDK